MSVGHVRLSVAWQASVATARLQNASGIPTAQ